MNPTKPTPKPTPKSKPHIVRTAAMTVTVFVTVVIWYVGSYGYWNWLKGRELTGSQSVSSMEWDDYLFAPLESYCFSGYPGHRKLEIFGRLWHDKGSGAKVTWSDIADDYDQAPPVAAEDPASK